jgi:hypothetical protein
MGLQHFKLPTSFWAYPEHYKTPLQTLIPFFTWVKNLRSSELPPLQAMGVTCVQQSCTLPTTRNCIERLGFGVIQLLHWQQILRKYEAFIS